MKSLQIISILALAMVAISLSLHEALEQSKIQKDKGQECVICSEDQK